MTGNQFRARDDITPLVAAPDLSVAAVFAMKVEKVLRLQELIREFGEGDAGFAREAVLDAG